MVFKGSAVALVTPFDENGKVNFDKIKELVEYHIENGTDAIVACGTTGEASTMSNEEKHAVIDFTVKFVQKRIPVIAGTGSNCTKSSIELSKFAQSVGCDGVLVVTTYYNKTTQEGLISHYMAIANSISIPIILYNVPSRTGLNILPQTALALSDIPNVVAVKEASR